MPTSREHPLNARAWRLAYQHHSEASDILHQYGAWFVTTYGVETLEGGYLYAIAADRLWENEGTDHDWEAHMWEKGWVSNGYHMMRAFKRARELHASKRPRSLRVVRHAH